MWIRTHKGRMTNLALATDVRIVTDEGKRGRTIVRAYFVGPDPEIADYTDLFEGTEEDCLAWFEELQRFAGSYEVNLPKKVEPGSPDDIPF